MNLVSKTLLSVALVLSLVGCTKESHAVFVRQEVPVIHPGAPSPVEVKEVPIEVWNNTVAKQRIEDPANSDKVWYVLDSEGLKNLNDNILETLRYIQQSDAGRQFYIDLINNYNESVRKEQESLDKSKDKPSK